MEHREMTAPKAVPNSAIGPIGTIVPIGFFARVYSISPMGLDRFLADSELKAGFLNTSETTRAERNRKKLTRRHSNVCKKTYDPLSDAFLRYLGGGAECYC